MVIACGISQYSIALAHLLNHAFFKGLLFLSAGAIIHCLADQQDLRKMGSLSILAPAPYASIVLGSLSLMAFPFLTGFYSKDLLLALLIAPDSLSRSVAFILGFTAAFISASYSVRMLRIGFLSPPLGSPLPWLPHSNSSPLSSSTLNDDATLQSHSGVPIGYA